MYEIDPKTMFGVVWLSLNTTILILYGIYPLLKNNCSRTRKEYEPKQEPEHDQDQDEDESDASTVSGLEGSEDECDKEEEDERDWKKTN